MNISQHDLEYQFNRINAAGWIAEFKHAGEMYDFPSSLLVAIGSRETNLHSILGDGGHGHGIMQIDDRSFPDYCRRWTSADIRENIHMGANVLKDKMNEAHAVARAHSKSFPDTATALRVAVAAYNSGTNAVQLFIAGRDPDARTTGHDYSADVMARAAAFLAYSKGMLT